MMSFFVTHQMEMFFNSRMGTMLKLLWRGMGLELCPTKFASQKMVNYMLSIQLIATLSGLLRPCPNVSASLLLSLAISVN